MESIGRFRVERQLGAGAFATVWLGYDDRLDANVAIKVLADNWVQDAEVRRRFVAEAQTLRRIRDPRVVVVHDIDEWEGRPYFVMDFADAGTVEDLVRARPDRRVALESAMDAAYAVQVLHDHQVLHRDVKPSNLLRHLRTDGTVQVMIADLGTMKALAEASGLTVTAGTPAYMAPEQARGQGLDERADVYGLAAVAYALLAGSPPFPGEAGVGEVAFRDPEQEPATLGPVLDHLLRPALAYDPEQRPRSAAGFARQIETVAAALAADATRAVTVQWTRPRRDTSRLVALGLVTLVLATALAWLVLGLLD